MTSVPRRRSAALAPVHAEKDDGRAREELRAVVDRHPERAAPGRHDQVDVAGLVLPAQERPQLALRRVAVEQAEVQVLGVEVDREGGLRLESRPERLVDADDRRGEPRIGVEQEDVPGWPAAIRLGLAEARREGRCHQDQKEDQPSHGPRGENAVPPTAAEARLRHSILLAASLRKYTSGPHAHKRPPGQGGVRRADRVPDVTTVEDAKESRRGAACAGYGRAAPSRCRLGRRRGDPAETEAFHSRPAASAADRRMQRPPVARGGTIPPASVSSEPCRVNSRGLPRGAAPWNASCLAPRGRDRRRTPRLRIFAMAHESPLDQRPIASWGGPRLPSRWIPVPSCR